MSTLEPIETGAFAPPSWVIFPPDSVRVVSWNIDRGLHLDRLRYMPSAPALVCGDFNLNASHGTAAEALDRANFADALANRGASTTPRPIFGQGEVIDWIFARRPIRSSQSQVHGSVMASDHYPLSADLAFS